jgi:hypothetical protein
MTVQNPFADAVTLARGALTPGISGTDLIAKLEARAEQWDQMVTGVTETATCRHCHRPISRVGGGSWKHEDPERCRGCRAASFREGEGWDDSLSRTWVAAPAKR